jgi:microcystin-dependent protein
MCYGQAVSRTTYADLFAVIGTTFGAGDGSTTFNLPDMRGRVAAGKDNMGGTAAGRLTSAGAGLDGTVLGTGGGTQSHTLTAAQIPAHSHTASSTFSGNQLPGHTHTTTDTTMDMQNVGSGMGEGWSGGNYRISYPANSRTSSSTSAGTPSGTVSTTVNNNTGGGNAHPNVQPTLVLNHIIKF